MVICGCSRVADPDRHEEPCLAQGATDEPCGSQRRAGNPPYPAYPAQMTGAKESAQVI